MLYKYEIPIRASLIVLWAGFVTGAYYISEQFEAALLIRFAVYLFIDPALLLTGSFYVSKLFGSRWYFTALMIVISAAVYFATPVRNVIPNLIAVTAICTVFGGGIGNVFSSRQQKQRKIDESYTPILGNEKNISKRKNKK